MQMSSYDITFKELPNEVSLTISIPGCGNSCPGCHSPHLQDPNSGKEVDLFELIGKYEQFITAVCFLGEVGEQILQPIKRLYPKLKIGIYTGHDTISIKLAKYLDFYKVGSYIEEKGALTSKTTNQRFYSVSDGGNRVEDITCKFWE